VNQELIERFFRKECTPAEAQRIADYLKANPSVVEKYLSFDEWKSVIADDAIPEEFWKGIWRNIQKRNRAKVIAIRLKRLAAAACITAVAGTAYLYFFPLKENAGSLTEVAGNKNIQLVTQHKTVANNTKKPVKLYLEDGSVVDLSPFSSIKYDVPFSDNKRDIILEGEAKFHVIKNKQKPFIVYSGNFATTALGTVFSVKGSTEKNIVSVKLFEGKVVVHATANNLSGWKDDVYLLSGEQLKFNAGTALFAVEKINGNKALNGDIDAGKKESHAVSDQLTFNNTLLPQVMNKLSEYYNIKIQYDSLFIDTMNFTGIVSRNDSAGIILKAIGQMNGLDVLKNGDVFILSKHEQ
jgi:transmembrane sensor